MFSSVQLCLCLLSVSGFLFGSSSNLLHPAFVVRVKVGDNATLRCPLLANSRTTTLTAVFPSTTTTAPTTSNPVPPSTTTTSTSRRPARILSWYRKFQGCKPEMLLTFDPFGPFEVKYGFGVRPDKVSPRSDGSLVLRGSELRDSAVYYCSITNGNLERGQDKYKIKLK